jgi:cell division transport system permease protein
MSWVTIKRIFRAGFLDFWRNAFVSFASILVMTVTLFVVGLTIFAGVMLNFTISELRNKVDVSVYFLTNTPEERILTLKSALEARPEVTSVGYISRDEALAQFRERYKDDQLALQALEELGQNPLEASLQIRAKDIAQYEAIAQFAESQDTESGTAASIDKISFYDAKYRVALDRLQDITNSAQRLGLIVIVILILTTIAISFNTLRLAIYSSREEIQVMRLVGAGQFFIRAPFMIEGMLYGLVAGVVTLLLFYPLTWWLGSATASFFGGVNIFTYYLENFLMFFGIIVGTGVVLGAIASYLAVRRYLKI